jgi:hypothetical protein
MSMSTVFKFPSVIRRQHDGPLGIHIDAYEALLQEEGYSRRSTYVHLHVVADFSRWLKRQRLDADHIGEQTVKRYLQCRRRFVERYRGASFVPYKFLGRLRDQGIINHKAPAVAADACKLAVADFERYLSKERGLSAATQCNYLPFAHQFLRGRFGRGPLRFSELRGSDITGFIQRHAYKRSPRSAQHIVGSLRAFLRCLRYRGEISTDLAACVPAVANCSYSSLPRFLQPGQVQQVLDHCKRQSDVATQLCDLAAPGAARLAGVRGGCYNARRHRLESGSFDGARQGGTACANAVVSRARSSDCRLSQERTPALCKSTFIHSGTCTAGGFCQFCCCIHACPTRLGRRWGRLAAHWRPCIQTLAGHNDAQAWSLPGGDRTAVASCTSGHDPNLCEG